ARRRVRQDSGRAGCARSQRSSRHGAPAAHGLRARRQTHRFFPVLKRIDDRRPAILFAESTARWQGTKGYVGNVAEAIALAAISDRAAGRTFNVGEKQIISELDWASRIAAWCDWPGELHVVPDDDAAAP